MAIVRFPQRQKSEKIGVTLIEANNFAKSIVAPIIDSDTINSYISFSKNISKHTSLNNIVSH